MGAEAEGRSEGPASDEAEEDDIVSMASSAVVMRGRISKSIEQVKGRGASVGMLPGIVRHFIEN